MIGKLKFKLRGPSVCVALFASAYLSALISLSAADSGPQTFKAIEHPSWLTIRLLTDRSEYKLGAPILVKIQETNVSPGILTYSHVAAHLNYDVIIARGSSIMQPYPVEGRTGHPAAVPIRHFAIMPNATATIPGSQGDYSPISDWGLKIEEPGAYVITAISRETKQKSNGVEIEITK